MKVHITFGWLDCIQTYRTTHVLLSIVNLECKLQRCADLHFMTHAGWNKIKCSKITNYPQSWHTNKRKYVPLQNPPSNYHSPSDDSMLPWQVKVTRVTPELVKAGSSFVLASSTFPLKLQYRTTLSCSSSQWWHWYSCCFALVTFEAVITHPSPLWNTSALCGELLRERVV